MLANRFMSTAVRTGLVLSLFAIFFAPSPNLHAQSSPLTVQPSTGRVGVGTTNPGASLEVSGELRLGNPGTGAWFKSNVDSQLIAIGGGTGWGTAS